MAEPTEDQIFPAVGEEGFTQLTTTFYAEVAMDAALRAMYPADLDPARLHLTWFLIQRFGGPDFFNQRRGPPRLRMRHMGLAVDQAARDAWIRHMRTALDATPAFAPFKDLLTRYFEDAATFLINC